MVLELLFVYFRNPYIKKTTVVLKRSSLLPLKDRASDS